MHHELFSHMHHGTEHRPHKVLRIGKWVVLGLVLATVFALLFGFLVTWLWNALMPKIFGLGEIGYWQAVGLLILAKIFFAGGEHHDPPQRFKKWQRPTTGSSSAGHEYAPIPHIPENQQDLYKRYWENHGKAAFEAYVNEHFKSSGKA